MQETRETQVQSLGQECSLEEEMATHSGILFWRIPWTEEPGGLQSIWSQGVRHHWAQHSMSEWTWVFIELLTSQNRDIDMMGLLVKEHSLPKNPNLKIKSRSLFRARLQWGDFICHFWMPLNTTLSVLLWHLSHTFSCSTDIDSLDYCIVSLSTKNPYSQSMLRNKNIAGGITLTDLKLDFKDIGIKKNMVMV